MLERTGVGTVREKGNEEAGCTWQIRVLLINKIRSTSLRPCLRYGNMMVTSNTLLTLAIELPPYHDWIDVITWQNIWDFGHT
jgi:hypothetical protein